MGSSSSYREVKAVVAGCVFAVAWWIWIDAHAYTTAKKTTSPEDQPILFYYYIPGLIGTLALIMINLVNLESLNPYSWMFDETIGTKVRLWLFLSFTVAFGSLAASIWVMAAVFMPPHNHGDQWPGVAMLLQNILIMFSAFVFLWAGMPSDPDDTPLMY